MRSESVQQERKPPDSPREKSQAIATSTQRIYIRKDFGSPSPAQPTFSSKHTEGVNVNYDTAAVKQEGLLANLQERLVQTDQGTVVLSNSNVSSPNTDLSTLANVVTTLATMGKNNDGEAGNDITSTPNGEASESNGSDSVAKAFDTMAKAVRPQANLSLNQSDNADSSLDQSSMSMDSQEECLLIDFEGNILSENNFQFSLTTPSPMPAYLNVHYICETASRLLFLSMHWARAIPAFQLLSHDVQITLVRSCWSELFTLGLAQCAQTMNLTTILTAIVNHLQNSVQQEKIAGERMKPVTDTIMRLQEYVSSMSRLHVDSSEYSYLKTIALFSPDHASLNTIRQIEKFQEKSHHELQDYVIQNYPDQTDRLGKLLLRLPALRLLSPQIMEELFFAGLIGNVQIDSIIPYILRMETAEYNSQMRMDTDVSSSSAMTSLLTAGGQHPVVIAPGPASGVHVVTTTSTGQVITPTVITVDNPDVSSVMS